MRKVVLLIIILVSLFIEGAFADSVSGRWSGTLSVGGEDYSATIRFDEGSFSASANGYTITGKYSLSSSSVRLNAMGYSMTLSLRERKGTQVLSGSARGFGKKGTISVSRKALTDSTPDGLALERSTAINLSKGGEWVGENSKHHFLLQLFSAGFGFWKECKLGEENLMKVYAALKVEEGAFLLVPFETAANSTDETTLSKWWVDDIGAYRIPYTLTPNGLTLGDTLILTQTEKRLDDKPAEAPFFPFLNLKQGDRGQAVVWLQQRLIDLGYLEDVADGEFGPKTLEAVKHFQADNAMDVDGIAGRVFMEHISPDACMPLCPPDTKLCQAGISVAP